MLLIYILTLIYRQWLFIFDVGGCFLLCFRTVDAGCEDVNNALVKQIQDWGMMNDTHGLCGTGQKCLYQVRGPITEYNNNTTSGSVRWRGGNLAFFSEVKCLKGLFIHGTESKQSLNIGGVEVGGRESPEVGRTLVEDCRVLQSANYDHGWSVSLWWQTGSRCELNISSRILPACVSRPLKCKRRMDR